MGIKSYRVQVERTRQGVHWLLAPDIPSTDPTIAGEQRYPRQGYLGRREA